MATTKDVLYDVCLLEQVERYAHSITWLPAHAHAFDHR